MNEMTKPVNGNGVAQRDDKGHFLPGTKPGPGRPRNSGKMARLRRALLRRVKNQDIAEVVEALLLKAKSGDVQAAKEILDRSIGRPLTPAVPVEDHDGNVQFSLDIGTPKIEVVYFNKPAPDGIMVNSRMLP